MLVLGSGDIADELFGDCDLRTAWRGKDLRDLVKIEVGTESLLHLLLLGNIARFFVYAGGVNGPAGTSYSPCDSEIQKTPALDFS
jgi:hypothetical protein